MDLWSPGLRKRKMIEKDYLVLRKGSSKTTRRELCCGEVCNTGKQETT